MEYNRPILLSNNQLPFNPTGIHDAYGVLINYCHKETTIHYEIECDFQEYLNNGNYLFSINRKDVFINNEPPDKKMYELATELAKSLYPVLLQIDKKNRITDIVNHLEIIKRCQLTRKRLDYYYGGDGAQACFNCFEHQYSNPNTIAAALEDDLFYKIYFLPLHTTYNPQLTAVSTIGLTFDGETIPFTITMQLAPDYNEKEKIVADIQGVNPVHAEATFTAQYQLYAEYHTIFSVTGAATYPEASGEYGRMEFEMYHLNPEEKIAHSTAISTGNAENFNKNHSLIIMEPADNT